VIGGIVERVIIRPVEGGPELNAVIVTLGVFVAFVALASIMFGNTLGPSRRRSPCRASSRVTSTWR
jgi:branched-subunit amino acid ABC-type transport system permease component